MIKSIVKNITFLLFLPFLAQTQNVLSPYLQFPERMTGYVDSCAQFWFDSYDPNLGGFYTNVAKDGSVLTNWGSNKNMLTQSRHAYGFVRAYMMTGNDQYLQMAQEALAFMYNHAWDDTYGGWYQEIDESGNPIYPFADKTAFYQHYALLGICAYYEATGDSIAYEWLLKGFNHTENYFWDNRSSYKGYYDKTDYDGSNPGDKSFNALVDAITTYQLSIHLIFNDLTVLIRMQQLAEQIKEHLVGSMPQQAIGFVEKFDSDWNWNNNETMTIMGHVLKTAWCLARIQQLAPDTSYLPAAHTLVSDVLNNGYDHEFGGPYKDYNRITGDMLMWGLPDTAKAWWQMEQAVTAGLQLFDLTDDSLYLQMADESLHFFMRYFVDHQYGEVYADRTRYGGFAWNEAKGSGGKAGYHSIELGYYVYLYAKTFLHQQPFTLYYKFEPQNQNYEIVLNPFAVDRNRLMIESVYLDDVLYTNYVSAERKLNIAAGVGGEFKVTFSPATTPVIVKNTEIPDNLTIYPNYPNPFNSTTTIRFHLVHASRVEIAVYGTRGRILTRLADKHFRTGMNTILWNASANSSGLYLIRIKTGTTTKTIKTLLIK